jgi:hypothetical protein
VSLIGYEDSETEQRATRKQRSRRKAGNPLRSADVAEHEVNEEAQSAEESSESSAAQTIDAEGEENPPEEQVQRSTGRKSRRTRIDLDSEDVEPPKRHLLDD